MIVVIDNGKGAQDISRMLKGSKVVPATGKIPEADAYILSDGEMDKKNEAANKKLIESLNVPLLAVGIGSIYLAKAYGGTAKELKLKINRLTMKQRSPLMLDFKKQFSVVDSQKYFIDECPECFGSLAAAPGYDYAIMQFGANPEVDEEPLPIFGVHFNPEAGLDGIKLLKNFQSFLDVWEKYH